MRDRKAWTGALALACLLVAPARADPPTLSLTDTTATSGVALEVLQPGLATGGGIALIDTDGDLLLDIVASAGPTSPLVMYRNLGGLVFDAIPASESGLTTCCGDYRGLAPADFDNDGDTDLFVANWAEGGQSLLLRNQAGAFSNVTSQLGVDVGGRASTAAWGDYDNDGFLDLYVSRYYDHQNLLFHNLGGTKLVDVTTISGLTAMAGVGPGEAQTFQALWLDIDRDGDLDLYELNDRCISGEQRNFLWLNQGDGTFVEDAAAFGLDWCLDAMGAALGDLDQDGLPDLFMTNIHYGHYLLRGGCKTYTPIANTAETLAFQWGWGVVFADLNHDTWPDLYIAHQSLATDDPTDRLYLNEGDQTFADTPVDIEHGESFVVVRGDLDLDGDLDLVVGRGGEGETHRILRNDGPTGHYLAVQLVGTSSNRDGIGAVVDVLAGGQWQRQIRHEQTSYSGRGDPALWFGLGEADSVERVVVSWPSGRQQSFVDVTADQVLSAVEPLEGPSGSPWDERCGDGLDNDCDGETDEGFGEGEPCEVSDDQGCVLPGVVTCAQGVVTCEPTPPDELCDGADNDCDGETDEGFDVGAPCTAGEAPCVATGALICDGDGLGVVCQAGPPVGEDEVCDGVDNDCDGDTDEGFGLGAPCSTGLGECTAAGVLACSPDGTSVVCDAPAGAPQDELCDALDNDCDGLTDEGFALGQACAIGEGACAAIGARVCDESGGTRCAGTPRPPSPERCDGQDNDCDGQIDEGFDVGGTCQVGLVTGVWVCDGAGAARCEGERRPPPPAEPVAEPPTVGAELDEEPAPLAAASDGAGCGAAPRAPGPPWALIVLFAALVALRLV